MTSRLKNQNNVPPLYKKRKVQFLLALVAVVLTFTGLVFAGVVQINLSCIGLSGTSRTFTMIASLDGYNDSKSIAGLGVWPIANVARCDQVTIRLVNTDTQPHGLAVGIYAMNGVQAQPSQTQSITFQAYKSGTFRIYCTVTSCSVHESMVNGQLNVT